MRYDDNSGSPPMTSEGGGLVPRAATAPLGVSELTYVHESAEHGFSFLALRSALRLWWPLAVPAALLLSTLALSAVYYLSEPQYEAVAWLRVDSRAPYLAFPTDSRKELGSPVQTQIELIRSPLVTERAVERPEVRGLSDILTHGSDPAVWLGRRLTINPVGESEFFQLSYSSTDPRQAAAICNAVLDVYLEVQAEFSDERTRRIIELLELEKNKWQHDQERLRGSVRDLASATGSQLVWSDENQQFRTIRGSLQTLTERLGAAQVEQEMLQAKITAQREALSRTTPFVGDAEIDAAVDLDPQVSKLQGAIVDKQMQLRQVEAVAANKDRDPQAQNLRRDLAASERQLSEVRTQIRPRVVQRQLDRIRGQQVQQLAEWEAQQQSFLALSKNLEEQIAAQRPEDRPREDARLDLEFARFDLARTEGVYDAITRRIDNLRTELRAPTQVGMVRRAPVPKRPMEATPLLKMMAAGIGGFLFPLGLVLVWERWRQRIAEPSQLEHDAQLPLLGTVARLSQNPLLPSTRRSRRLGQRLDQYLESIEYVRVNLAVSDCLRQVQSILVASAVSHEGKTRLACGLAQSLASAEGGKTLLIDADFRSPELHLLFDCPGTQGLADVLAGSAQWRECIVRPRGQQVDVMPAGRALQSPHSLLCGPRLQELLADLRPHYRFIIIDGPPVLLVSDALVLAHAVDATLLSAMHNHSREPEMRSALDRLQMAGARVLGTVLNGVPAGRYGYGVYGYGRPRSAPPQEFAAIQPLSQREVYIDRTRA